MIQDVFLNGLGILLRVCIYPILKLLYQKIQADLCKI